MEELNHEAGERPSLVPITNHEPAALDIIRTETVLSRLPVHNLAKKGRVDIRILKTTPTGAVELKWEVSYNERYGQARQLAYKLDTIIINRRIDDAGKPLPEIIRIGSLNQICRELGSQKNELKRALQQNATTAINAKLMYKGNDGSERQLEALFTRYSVIFTGEKLPDGRKADSVYIILNKPYREVLDNAPVRPLDREYMKELPPAPQRFYEIISYKIFSALKNNRPHARLAYSEYCTFSAQHRSLDWEFVRPQMYQVHQPHLKSGYLMKPIRHEATTDSHGNLDWIFYYIPGAKARAEFAAAHRGRKSLAIESESIEAGEARKPLRTRRHQHRVQPHTSAVSESHSASSAASNPQLVAELTHRGVTENAARELLMNLTAGQEVLRQLEWGDSQIQQSRGKISNPAGFYISLVSGNVSPPPTFETSAQRTAREEEDRRRAEEHRKQEELETEYDWYCEREIDGYIAALDPAEVATVLDAKRQEMREKYKTPWMIDQFTQQETRRELGTRAPRMTIEEFKASREEGAGLSPKSVAEPLTAEPETGGAVLSTTSLEETAVDQPSANTAADPPAAAPERGEAIELFVEPATPPSREQGSTSSPSPTSEVSFRASPLTAASEPAQVTTEPALSPEEPPVIYPQLL